MPEEDKVRIRTAMQGDLDAIDKIENASFGSYDEPFPRSIFQGFLETNPEGFRVAELDLNIVGYCYTSPLERQLLGRKFRATIYSLAVDPHQRHLGIGSSLLKDAIERLRGRSKIVVELQVAVANRDAQNLYRKFGFVESRELHDYYGSGKHAYEMKLDLTGQL
ncbi:MAG: GNAT family N-acetyltransferase [Nitrososphaerales archaeon]